MHKSEQVRFINQSGTDDYFPLALLSSVLQSFFYLLSNETLEGLHKIICVLRFQRKEIVYSCSLIIYCSSSKFPVLTPDGNPPVAIGGPPVGEN